MKLLRPTHPWVKTNMTRTRGQPLLARIPHGHVWTPLRMQDESLVQDAARDRVLPCVRPLLRPCRWPRARMGVRGSGPHHWNALEALPMRLVLLIPPRRLAPYLSFDLLTPLTASRPSRSGGYGRSSVAFSLRQQCPGDTGILVRQCDNHQHRRLTLEHAPEPGAFRHPFALGPGTTALAAIIRSRRRVRSPNLDVRPSRSLPPVSAAPVLIRPRQRSHGPTGTSPLAVQAPLSRSRSGGRSQAQSSDAGSCRLPSIPAISSSSTISAATRASRRATPSAMPAPICSSCRLTAPISIRVWMAPAGQGCQTGFGKRVGCGHVYGV